MDTIYQKMSRSHSSFLKGAERSMDRNSKQFFSQASKNPIRSQNLYVSSLILKPEMATEPFIQSAMRQLHLSAGLSRWTMAGHVGHLEGSSCCECWRGPSREGQPHTALPGSSFLSPTWMCIQPLHTWARALGTIHYASDRTSLQLPGELRWGMLNCTAK